MPSKKQLLHRAQQSKRVNNWDLIDFTGSFSSVHADTEKLLRIIGAWDEFGASGWGVNGTEEIFGTTKTNHATGSETLFDELFTKEIEKKVEKMYFADYDNVRIANALRPHAMSEVGND